MPARESNLHKHTLKLYRGDYEKMREHYPDLGGAMAIRQLVRSHLQRLDTVGTAPDDLANITLED